MDKELLGRRLAQARDDAGVTQEALGRAVGLDRTAIVRLEKGDRKLSVPELVAVAEVLGRPLAYFVADPVPAVVSRRRDATGEHGSSRALDTELEAFAADVRTLVGMGLLTTVAHDPAARTPRDHDDAARLAQEARRRLGLVHEPVDDLGEACARLGLFTYAAPLGPDGADGACAEAVPEDTGSALGAAVVNGQSPPGRRRMTLAHELGHWLSGDAYDDAAPIDTEPFVRSFAIHFLAPGPGLRTVWERHTDPPRDRALRVAATFRLSWSAAVSQLRNTSLISRPEYDLLRQDEPRSGDYLRLGLTWSTELASPYLSPQFSAACLTGYTSGTLTAARTLELLRGTVTTDDLPRPVTTLDDLRPSFTGHDA